jgi:hypothetical protein
MQGYLFKLPNAFLEVFGIEAIAADRRSSVKPLFGQKLGEDYRSADEVF